MLEHEMYASFFLFFFFFFNVGLYELLHGCLLDFMYLFVMHVSEKAKGINYKGVSMCLSELSVIFMIHLLPSVLF